MPAGSYIHGIPESAHTYEFLLHHQPRPTLFATNNPCLEILGCSPLLCSLISCALKLLSYFCPFFCLPPSCNPVAAKNTNLAQPPLLFCLRLHAHTAAHSAHRPHPWPQRAYYDIIRPYCLLHTTALTHQILPQEIYRGLPPALQQHRIHSPAARRLQAQARSKSQGNPVAPQPLLTSYSPTPARRIQKCIQNTSPLRL